MTDLIIGAHGFIGQNLVRSYIESGNDFEVYNLPQSLQKRGLDFAPLIQFLEKSQEYINIIDCVGVKKLTYFNETYDSNLLISLKSEYQKLMDQIEKKSKGRFIFLSSGGSVYGDTNYKLAHENLELHPTTFYGKVNKEIEELIVSRNSIIIRASNIYGFNSKGSIKQGFIETSILRVLTNNQVILFGQGKAVRDYMYIEDFVNIILQLSDSNLSGIYNVGSGIGHNQMEILNLIKKNLSDKTFNISNQPLPRYLHKLDYNVLDITKIRSIVIDYPNPDIRLGLVKTINLFKQFLSS